jgi:hypothetical protein
MIPHYVIMFPDCIQLDRVYDKLLRALSRVYLTFSFSTQIAFVGSRII